MRPTVKIGLVAPFEGRYRYVGYDVIYAVRLALREANEAGGVEGYYVELVAYDDGADPAMAAQQARKLDVDPDVVAALGHFREETTAAASSTYADAGLPLLVPAALDPGLAEAGKMVHRLGPGADVLAAALLDGADRLFPPDAPSSAREIVLVSGGGPWGRAVQGAAEGRSEHIALVVSPDQDDWPAEVLDLNPSVILCSADPVTAGEVVSSLGRAGWEGDFVGGPALAASDFVAVAGEAAEGVLFVTPWPFPKDVPGGGDFAAAYREVSNGTSPGPLTLPAYKATRVLLGALERDIARHGGPTREGMAAALAGADRGEILGEVDFDSDLGWDGESLYWYRIGVGGAPRLIRRVPALR